MPTPPAPPVARRTQPPATAVPIEIEAHPVRFTGSGREYFRVWIVNVLLSILTLGLYTPWARRRTAQYFYGHTLVAHSPLECTAAQKRMVFGFVVLVVLTLAYQIAVNTGQDTAVALLLVAGAALAPLLWGSAMRFRLSATRWRGLRLQFVASWREVYRASWPVFALALVWIGVTYGLDTRSPPGPEGAGVSKMPKFTPAMGGLLLLGLALSVLCAIRIEYNYKSLLVTQSRLGTEPGRWKPQYMDFVRIWAATVGVFLLGLLATSALVAALLGDWLAPLKSMGGGAALTIVLLIMVLLVLGFFLLLASAPARAYREARMFQLMWDNIGLSQVARFKCHLNAWRFVRLRMKNLLFTLLTLGFYRPFARVNEYRMKANSVTLHIKGGVDQVRGVLVRQQQGGVGDALADAVGLDLV
ncbi:MAG: YjgN family protein [Burkholderiaceae bacterium]